MVRIGTRYGFWGAGPLAVSFLAAMLVAAAFVAASGGVAEAGGHRARFARHHQRAGLTHPGYGCYQRPPYFCTNRPTGRFYITAEDWPDSFEDLPTHYDMPAPRYRHRFVRHRTAKRIPAGAAVAGLRARG